MKYISYILLALVVTAVNLYIAISGVLALVLEGGAQEDAIWAFVPALYTYGSSIGSLSLAGLLFLPLFKLKYSRTIGWLLASNGIFPFAVLGMIKLFHSS